MINKGSEILTLTINKYYHWRKRDNKQTTKYNRDLLNIVRLIIRFQIDLYMIVPIKIPNKRQTDEKLFGDPRDRHRRRLDEIKNTEILKNKMRVHTVSIGYHCGDDQVWKHISGGKLTLIWRLNEGRSTYIFSTTLQRGY